jgi:hypothetical protein
MKRWGELERARVGKNRLVVAGAEPPASPTAAVTDDDRIERLALPQPIPHREVARFSAA